MAVYILLIWIYYRIKVVFWGILGMILYLCLFVALSFKRTLFMPQTSAAEWRLLCLKEQ